MLNPSIANDKLSKSNMYRHARDYRRSVKPATKARHYNRAYLNCTPEDFDTFKKMVG